MARALKRLERWLGSPRLAFGLMLYLCALVFIGTVTSPASETAPRVAAWIAAHPTWAGLVRGAGLDRVYSSWPLVIGVALLTASTVVCAWRRTKVALSRFRLLRSVRSSSDESLPAPDYSVSADACRSADEALTSTLRALTPLLRVRWERRGDAAYGSSSPLTVFGSPVFHWALVGLMLAVAFGALVRSEGLVGVPVGDSVPDSASVYGRVSAGPMHRWPGEDRRIAVESLALVNTIGGIDRGATPRVVLRTASGTLIAQGDVYPNHPLNVGSVTVHPNDYGLAARISLVGSDGRDIATAPLLIDFASGASRTALPSEFGLTGPDGSTQLTVRVVVPLDYRGSTWQRTVPRSQNVQIVVIDGAGAVVASGTISPGQEIALPEGSRLVLRELGYYARLSVVDDPSIPAVYCLLLIGVLGLGVAMLAPQRCVVVRAHDSAGEVTVTVFARLWRNAGTTSEELRATLDGRLCRDEDE